MMADSVIECINLTRSFRNTPALSDVNLTIDRGKILVLLGANGSGKTTLARVIMGELKPDSGRVQFTGFRGIKHPVPAFSPQTLHLFDNLSVAENLFLGRLPVPGPFSINRSQLRADTRRLLDRLHLQDISPTRRVGTLSYAEKYLLQFGRAIAHGSPVLILDELTAVLTDNEIQAVHSILREEAAKGTAVLYITHNIQEGLEIADKVAVLKAGRLQMLADKTDISKDMLFNIMLGEQRHEHYPKLPQKPGPPILKVRNLQTKFIRDLSLDLHRGEIIGIAGCAGSGRTRLLRAIAGLDLPVSGSIEINDRLIGNKQGPHPGIGYLPEDRDKEALFLNVDVGENINIQNLRPLFVNAEQDDLRARDIIERIGIPGAKPASDLVTLSNGNRQKVVISRCILSKCNIFLFDEPTWAVDAVGKVEIYNIINRLLSIGAAVIMVSSNIEELTSMCDRVLVMQKGSPVAEFTTDEQGASGTAALLTKKHSPKSASRECYRQICLEPRPAEH